MAVLIPYTSDRLAARMIGANILEAFEVYSLQFRAYASFFVQFVVSLCWGMKIVDS